MNLQYIEYSNKKSILNSIIFLVLGIILFTNPVGVMNYISLVFGVIIAIMGLINIVKYLIMKRKTGFSDNIKLSLGLFLVILGIAIPFLTTLIETVIRLVIGAFIIYNGIMRLIDAINNKRDLISFIIILIVALLIVVAGFYILIEAGLVYKTIGLIIIIYSILDIIGFISFRKQN